MHRVDPLSRRVLGLLIPALLSTAFCGCASAPNPAVPPPVIAFAPQRAGGPPENRPPRLPALYRSPRIATVYLRAHIDAEGRLLGPQIMYQIADPGGWNVEALDTDTPTSLPVPPDPSAPRGATSAPPRVAASAAPPAKANPSTVAIASPLLDPGRAARLRFTGLMSKSQGAAARTLAAEAGADVRAVFDDDAGWLLEFPPASSHPADFKRP